MDRSLTVDLSGGMEAGVSYSAISVISLALNVTVWHNYGTVIKAKKLASDIIIQTPNLI